MATLLGLVILKDTQTSTVWIYEIIKKICKEVMYEDIVKYCELCNIKKLNIKKLYEFYKSSFNAKEIKQYEWLLEEL